MFSQYIRTRDCLLTTGTKENGKCVTCGRVYPFKDLQAGHAIGGRCNSILFDEQLVNAQCVSCNLFRYGRQAEYSVWFIEKYGMDCWKEKVALKFKPMELDFEQKYYEYKEKLIQLEQVK